MSKESSLRASFWDGVYASVMFGVTVNYVTPFALLIGATAFQVGVLNSLPLLFGALIQLYSDEITKKFKSRVSSITLFVFLQAVSWFFVCAVVFIPPKFRLSAFILLIIINNLLGSVVTPAWASLMSDTVDANRYGEYFSWRGKVLGFINLVSSFVAGFFLFVVPVKVVGFLVLFAVAGVMRILSAVYLSRMDDIRYEQPKEKEFTYLKFIKRIKESNFVKFVFFVSLLNFGVFLASPFFAVYMLDELKFRYSTYTIITVAAALSGLVTLPFWGRLSDKFGNVKVIKITASLSPLLPILWLFTRNPILLSMINALAGYVWAGFNLAVVNFIFDAASKEVRTRCFAYFSFTNGVFVFAGTLIGGWLAINLPFSIAGSRLLVLFLLSGILRLAVNILLLREFREVKEVPSIAPREMFYMVLGISTVLNLGDGVFYRKNKKSNEI